MEMAAAAQLHVVWYGCWRGSGCFAGWTAHLDIFLLVRLDLNL